MSLLVPTEISPYNRYNVVRTQNFLKFYLFVLVEDRLITEEMENFKI